MEPKGAEMKPQGLPKVPKASQLYPMCVKMESQGATMERQGHSKCQRDTTRPCKVPQRLKKHVRTARGRVLAEGDVDPAAGSRDEPTRLPVEAPVAERKQVFEVQVTRALFL